MFSNVFWVGLRWNIREEVVFKVSRRMLFGTLSARIIIKYRTINLSANITSVKLRFSIYFVTRRMKLIKSLKILKTLIRTKHLQNT